MFSFIHILCVIHISGGVKYAMDSIVDSTQLHTHRNRSTTVANTERKPTQLKKE